MPPRLRHNMLWRYQPRLIRPCDRHLTSVQSRCMKRPNAFIHRQCQPSLKFPIAPLHTTVSVKATEAWPGAVSEGKSISGNWPESVKAVGLQDDQLNVVFQNGDRFVPNLFYLRDHCSCRNCRHEVTKQRLIDTFELPIDPTVEDIRSSQDGISITWREDSHESFYPWRWLALHGHRSSHGWKVADIDGKEQTVTTWGSSIHEHPPSVEYEKVMHTEDGVRLWTKLIRQYGFCYVDGCPPTPEATEKLLEKIAFIRNTHYGGFWDFTSDLRSKDTAYTSIALEAHTDTTYFRDPAGLQMFHLLSHTEGEGGRSLLVDGWNAAAVLRSEDPDAYAILKTQPMRWHCSGNEDVQIGASGPVLADHIPHNGATIWPTLIPGPIRWNNSDRANSVGVDHEKYSKWLSAARRWNTIIKDPAMEYWEQLRPGRPLIFDNQRVLHGRSSFTGKRRLCGGYINMDDFISRWRTLNFKRDLLLDHQA